MITREELASMEKRVIPLLDEEAKEYLNVVREKFNYPFGRMFYGRFLELTLNFRRYYHHENTVSRKILENFEFDASKDVFEETHREMKKKNLAFTVDGVTVSYTRASHFLYEHYVSQDKEIPVTIIDQLLEQYGLSSITPRDRKRLGMLLRSIACEEGMPEEEKKKREEKRKQQQLEIMQQGMMRLGSVIARWEPGLDSMNVSVDSRVLPLKEAARELYGRYVARKKEIPAEIIDRMVEELFIQKYGHLNVPDLERTMIREYVKNRIIVGNIK